jgi:hypothetical protein
MAYDFVHYATVNPFGSQQLRPMISADRRQNVVNPFYGLELSPKRDNYFAGFAPSGAAFYGIDAATQRRNETAAEARLRTAK